MKYEFHVGDYVETVGGFVGWICRTGDNGYIWVANKDIAYCSYRIPEELKYFVRIGQYDFTKKDEGKIELLDYTERFIRNSTVDTTLISFMKKINELVDAVNRLEEKIG